MRTIAITTALVAGSLALIAPAVAQRLNVPANDWLSTAEVTEKLSANGYKVIEIESDDGAYDVEMVDKNGVRIDTHVHPATGEILRGYDD